MEEDKDFIDFEFNGRWASEFKLLAVSDGDRYTSPFYGSVSPNTSTLVGKVGVHKWKTQVGEKEFNIQIAYDDVDLGTLRKIKEWLNPFVIGKLVFKEEPYKYYWVSLSEDPQISFLPFRTEDLIVDGKSYKKGVYKGDFTLNFICVDNYGYSDWSSFDENFDYLVNEIKGENFITFDDGSDNNLILTKIEGGFAQETKSAIPYTNVEGNNLQLTDVENVDTQNWIIKGGHHQVQTDEEKTIVNGESISISDVDDSKPADIVTKGNHYQATREGYNLLDLSNLKDETSAGISRITEEGKITLNGTPESTSYNETIYTFIAKESGVYTLLPFKKTAVPSIRLIFKVNDGQFISNDSQTQISLNENDVLLINLRIDALDKITNFSLQPMLYLGTDIKPFEQYGVSPLPDYSSEIETVGSNVNGFDLISYYNTARVVNATKQLLNNGIKLNFEAKADAYIGTVLNEGETLNKNWRSGCVAVEPNTTYTIQVSSAPKCYISYLDENYKAIKGFTQLFGNVTFTTDARTHYIYFRFGYNNSASTLTFYEFTNIKIEKGSVATPYSPFGMGSVEIDVVNSNLLDFNVAQDSRVTVNEDGTLIINGAGGFSLNIDKLQLKAGITYYQKVELISGSISGLNINNTFLSFTGTGAWISSENFSQTNLTKDTEKTTILINASAIFNNAVIRIWANTDKSDFVKHQSKTTIIPTQQEMLEGDYIKDVEHHEWQKFIFDGVTNRLNKKAGTSANNLYYTSYISNLLAPTSNGVKIEICSNCFKSYTANQLYGQDLVGVAVTTGKSFSIGFGLESSIDTLDKANEKLKELYDAGTPIIIYYKLAEAIDLELTSEQKTAMNELNTSQFYPNITNLSLSNSVAKVNFDYNGYDGMPNPRHPSDLQVVKDSVDITISNKNLFDFNKLNAQNTNLTIQDNKLIGNNVPNIVIGAVPDSTALMKKTLLPGTYTVSFDITSENSNELLNCYFCCQEIDGNYNNYYNGKAIILPPNEKNRVSYEYKITKAVQKIGIVGYLQGNTNLEISNIAIIEGTDNKYTEYKEQVISMPVQQELFKDDYIEDVEHHEWKKIIVDGVNYGAFYVFPNGRFVVANPSTGEVAGRDIVAIRDWAVAEPQNICCTHLPTVSVADQAQKNMLGITNGATGEIAIKLDRSTEDNSTWTSEAVNEYLQQQNEKGQPLTVWYKTTEPYDLELTEDQADIKENCKDFVCSYPGANYISANTTLPKLSISYMPEQDLAIDFVADGSNLLNSSSFYYTNEIYLKSFKDKETGNPDTSGITSSRAEYLFNAGNQPANLNLTFDYIPPQQGAPLEINIDKVQLTNNGWKTLEKKYTSISLEYFEAFKPFTDLLKKAYSIDDLSNLPSNWQNDWQLEINSEIKEIYFKNKHNKDLVISLNKFNKKQEFLQLSGSNFVDYSKPFPTLITEVEESAIADTYFNKVYLTATAQDYRLKNINLEWKHTYL